MINKETDNTMTDQKHPLQRLFEDSRFKFHLCGLSGELQGGDCLAVKVCDLNAFISELFLIGYNRGLEFTGLSHAECQDIQSAIRTLGVRQRAPRPDPACLVYFPTVPFVSE